MIPLYTFFGMKRSGQHAIINWICKQHGGGITYKNNCNLQGHGRGTVALYKEGGAFGAWNFEDPDIAKIIQVMGSNRFHGAIPILIIRDPYNWIASCMHRLVTSDSKIEHDVALKLPKRIETYKEHIKQTIDDLMVISFNKWFSDSQYREGICAALEIPFTDEGKHEVTRYGDGSSFDQRKYDGNAQQMQVLQRWEQYVNNKKYLEYIDDELKEIAKTAFNIGPLT